MSNLVHAVAEEGPSLQIRSMVPADEAFVFSCWLKGAKVGTYEAKRVRDAVYYKRRHKLVERILARGKTLVAHLEGDPDTILGYIVGEPDRSPPVLHWVFVKLPFRRLGVATRLIETMVPDPNAARFTCWTIWSLAVPAPRGTDRSDRKAVQAGRFNAIREANQRGEAGGDTEDLVRKFPGLVYDPDARWEED